jgi:dihydroorotate dehydrogenase
LVAYYYDSRSALHEHVAMPLIRLLADPETGHKLSIKLLAAPSWMRPRDRGVDGEELQTEVSACACKGLGCSYYQLFGMKLKNPVGMAAGLDKDGEAIDGLFDLGFGYVEVGSVTPEPQVSPSIMTSQKQADLRSLGTLNLVSLDWKKTTQQLIDTALIP